MQSLLSLNTRGGRAVGKRVSFSPSHLPFLIYRSRLPSVLRANPAVAFRTLWCTSSILRSEQNGDNRAKAAKLSKEARIGKVIEEVQLPSNVDG